VVKVTGSEQTPVINGEGECLEYAVKMQRFSRNQELGLLLRQQLVANEKFWTFSVDLAHFHEMAEVADKHSRFATLDALKQSEMENFTHVSRNLNSPELLKRVEILKHWTEASLAAKVELFDKRRQQGRVRECHGDLHLGNLVMLKQKIVPFDCLEFNEDFRWIDVASEIAFLLMDLKANGFDEYARVVLNGYLEASADFELVQLLRHYTVYRAMVRAKVACLRDAQTDEQSDLDAELLKYLELAEQSEKRPFQGRIILTHGFSGCGKTWLSKQLLEVAELILIRSDIVRKSLHKLETDKPAGSGVGQGHYAAAARDEVYRVLLEHTESVVNAGYPVIVDATFLNKKQRMEFRNLSEDCGVPFQILDIKASRDVLESRIIAREEQGRDASEADLSVLAYQLKTAEPFATDEEPFVVEVNAEQQIDRPGLVLLAQQLDLR